MPVVVLVLAAILAHAQRSAGPRPLTPDDQHALELQVALDRAGFSPGEIDAAMGTNTTRALDAFNEARHVEAPEAVNPLIEYTITEEDAAGPFTPVIPDDLMQQANLPSLGYRNVLEEIAERFHASPALLKRLNPGKPFVAGDQILVPNVLDTVQPIAPPRGQRQTPSTNGAAAVLITVSRAMSALTITDATGLVLFYAPVTTGSDRDPLPIGEWKITGVQYDPSFHYNPDLFWDAEPTHAKATIPPGPNNPVGVVWMDISRPHYGIHGTPEPSAIGRSESHGCVRLTNWDALKVASLVHPGTRVVFKE